MWMIHGPLFMGWIKTSPISNICIYNPQPNPTRVWLVSTFYTWWIELSWEFYQPNPYTPLLTKFWGGVLFYFIYFFKTVGPVISGVLFRLNGLGLRLNDPVRGHRHIRGWSTKVEVEMALQEELKVIYNRPKPIRGEKSHRDIYPRWFETFLSSWILF